ncbi:thaumatin family protein [Streptomyces fuscigenes]|uniref:thaumatin family protein n=1 Tax=Streptomyces fuscigenes TaxID=1528880 RepID=UPI001F43EB67|nr:thaumatin family protein [Streptomyces fuscigenes]MCF3960259.1 Thaumatin pathogenesis-like protein [Streptomyces fuscigenes]
MRRRTRSLLLALLLVIVGVSGTATAVHFSRSATPINEAATAGSADHTLTIVNNTDAPIWVGSVVNGDGSIPLTGLPQLAPGAKSEPIAIPEHTGPGFWRGRIFARQGCGGENGSTFHCAVGDCGPYVDHCSVGEQPASLAEFNFNPSDPAGVWYDASYVDAVSTPVTITPNDVNGPTDGECSATGCAIDLLSSCPPANLTKDPATGRPLVCVNPNRDAPTPYSDAIEKRCPTAYAWSAQDHEQGNQTMRSCSRCHGMTITFGVGSGTGGPAHTVRPPVHTKPHPVKKPVPPPRRTTAHRPSRPGTRGTSGASGSTPSTEPGRPSPSPA